MRRRVGSLTGSFTLALLVVGSAGFAVHAQESASALTTTVEGVTLGWTLSGRAPGSSSIHGMVAVGPSVTSGPVGLPEVRRLVVDTSGAVRFAYAVRVEREGSDRIRIHARPIDAAETLRLLEPEAQRLAAHAAVDRPVPTLSSDQVVSGLAVGDVVRLDLFEHVRSGERIADVLTVRAVVPQPTPPRRP